MASEAKDMAGLEGLVESLGNISKACERMGVSRSYYYKWRSRQAIAPANGPRGKRAHPQSVPAVLKAIVLELAKDFPEWGSNRISLYLELEKDYVSPTTVRKILNRNGLGSRRQREQG